MADERPVTQCLQCGQADDHPKVWVDAGPKHYDCLAYAEREAAKTNEAVTAIIATAESGTHGPELVDHIVSTYGGSDSE
jgi:hypothetical protein